jgi:hypothetical protein
MRTVALIFLTVSALVGTVGAVSAQYAGGYYGPGPYYGGRYYDDGRYYRRGYPYGAIIGYDRFGGPEWNFPVGPGRRCPRHYAVQNGLCKPYPYRGAYY